MYMDNRYKEMERGSENLKKSQIREKWGFQNILLEREREIDREREREREMGSGEKEMIR